MCRIIFEQAGLVRRISVSCAATSAEMLTGVEMVHSLTGWRFAAIEPCVFSDLRLGDDDEARLRAL